LADGENIEKHKNTLAYVEIEVKSPANGEFSAMWAPDGVTVSVSGPCPACGARTASEYKPGIVGTKGFRRSPTTPQALRSPVTIYCECGHAHANRPSDALDKGCGRYWLVFLTDDERQPPKAGTVGTATAPAAP
jgi:hypothetical protein